MATLMKEGKARAIAHFHYALCLQIELEQYQIAREQYIKSIELMSNDHRTIAFKRIIDNFNFLMTELLNSDHDGVEEYKLHQERIGLELAKEFSKHGRFQFAARTLQRYARRRLARIRVKEIKSSESYRLRMKRKMVGSKKEEKKKERKTSLTDESLPPGVISLPPGIVSGGEESEAPPGIFSGDEESEAPPGIFSGDEESEAPPGIFSGSEAPPGILSGEDAPPGIFSGSEGPPGILSGDEDMNIFESSSDSDEDEDRSWRAREEQWEKHQDEDGNVYFYNIETGVSTWDVRSV